MYYTLKDKFVDHGLISVVILKKKSDTEVFVNTWLMSYNELKRGMGEYIVNGMIRATEAQEFTIVTAEYIPTAKNAMVKDIYKTMAFTEYEEH